RYQSVGDVLGTVTQSFVARVNHLAELISDFGSDFSNRASLKRGTLMGVSFLWRGICVTGGQLGRIALSLVPTSMLRCLAPL
ncbi:MAG TPA: hypothetical protein PKE20_03200, partial [Promineifilum sp.]|nr:hypothetical protein [Promineifilum sp.]